MFRIPKQPQLSVIVYFNISRRNLQSFEKALANSFETLSTGAVEIAG